jgi:methylated-DNA-[protein]-cysteine S-methyltransferase
LAPNVRKRVEAAVPVSYMRHICVIRRNPMDTTDMPSSLSAAPIGYAIVDTAIGAIAIAWSAAGICRLALPQRDREAMERRFAAKLDGAQPGEPPAGIAAAIVLIKRYANGEAVDFSNVPVDLDGVDLFRQAIYQAARKLGFGQTTTYGGLADAAGHPGMARETGEALGRNPVPLIVPCHRIHAAGGKIGGFSAPGGSATKEKLLALEGVRVGPPPAAQKAFAF